MDVIGLTKELMTFKTNSEKDNCHDFIARKIISLGLKPTYFESQGIKSIAYLPEDYKVLLMAHYDVVYAPDELFKPRESEGMLWGRGSADDKYAVAILLKLLEEFSSPHFAVLITGDEEVGGRNGAGHALQSIRPEFAIALDGGPPEQIITKGKGLLRARLVARGKSAHGAYPWLGTNAIEILISDLQTIRKYFSNIKGWHRTLNIGGIEGGKAVNMVPDNAQAELDIRFTEADDMDALIQRLKEEISSELIVQSKDPAFFGGRSELYRIFRKTVGNPEEATINAATDARFVEGDAVIWGAQMFGTAHQDDEHVEIQSVYDVYDKLKKFLEVTR